MKRLMFTPFWKLTRWGFLPQALKIKTGCDEWHTISKYIIIPLVGEFALFEKKLEWFSEYHVWYYGPDGFEGRIVEGCDICQNFIEFVTELEPEVAPGVPLLPSYESGTLDSQ
jgi:hypothetical protein